MEVKEAPTVSDNPELQRYYQRFYDLKNNEWAESTEDQYNGALKKFYSWLEATDRSITEVDKRDFNAFLGHLENQGYGGHSLTSAYYPLRSFFSDLVDEGIVDDNPVQKVNINKKQLVKEVRGGSRRTNELRKKGNINWVTAEEVEQMCECSDEIAGHSLRNELVIRLLFQTGVRRTELTEIKLEDIDDTTNLPSIEVVTLKNNSMNNRTVYYQNSLQTSLDIWINAVRDDLFGAKDSPYLFPSRQSEQISTDTVNNIVKDSAEAAGVQSTAFRNQAGQSINAVTAHCLRHSMAIEALNSGIDVRTIQKVMGHSDISTTQRYLDVIDKGVSEKMKLFGSRRD